MATQSAITLNTYVYNPAGTSGGISTWLDKATNGASAAAKLTESVRGPSAAGMFRAQFKLDLPVVAAADSVCHCAGTVIGTAVCNIDVVIPAGFAPTDRDNLVKQIQALVAGAAFTSAVKDLEGAW